MDETQKVPEAEGAMPQTPAPMTEEEKMKKEAEEAAAAAAAPEPEAPQA